MLKVFDAKSYWTSNRGGGGQQKKKGGRQEIFLYPGQWKLDKKII